MSKKTTVSLISTELMGRAKHQSRHYAECRRALVIKSPCICRVTAVFRGKEQINNIASDVLYGKNNNIAYCIIENEVSEKKIGLSHRFLVISVPPYGDRPPKIVKAGRGRIDPLDQLLGTNSEFDSAFGLNE